MKITVEVNGKATEITLTADQVKKVKDTPVKITDRIQGWLDVCEILNIHPENILPYKLPANSFEEWVNSCVICAKVCDAYNEGVVMDLTNSRQEKHYPVYRYDVNSGFGFSYSYSRTLYGHSHTFVGARLCLVSEELVLDMVKKFDDVLKIRLGNESVQNQKMQATCGLNQ